MHGHGVPLDRGARARRARTDATALERRVSLTPDDATLASTLAEILATPAQAPAPTPPGKEMQKRKCVAMELFDSERRYVAALGVIESVRRGVGER